MFSSTVFEFEVVKTITCVIDEERSNAIDIETGEIWHLVKRNELGNILNEEFEAILDEKGCALMARDKDWEKISLLYQLSLKDRAKKIYRRYLDGLTNKDEKVKKIGKMERK